MAQAAAGKKNWFAIWVSVAVVVVVALVIALVVWMNRAATDPGTAPAGSGINQETGAIAVGSGSQTLDTYVDFMCPICNQFEQTYGGEILDLANKGTITLNIHPISILDRASQGTKYSTRAANAMYCVAEAAPDKAVAFMQALYKSQPEENSTGLTDQQIIDIATGVGVTGIDSCVTGGTYTKFVTSMTQKTPIQPGSSGIGTPTLAVNGTVIANQSIPAKGQFASLFK
ncbi:thioredoxin domain-containing protein [Microbacterium sp. VKM Ac-2870]|uniref:DsbA family protein n=1 Tax=Microbacterium sp. VKM Ac-2870 TaxID=2783825 RepID=UPI00188B1660|nr:thioredoxin domain-containing protein [Microbacterium sp. VKM Ac-2870]MBF4561418.1 thioredoxin domain-containing protein [Microbacterium sp. VKM Ac-2870]